MYFGNGNVLTDRLFGAKATCPRCRNHLTFRAGAELAQENDIHDNVVVCGGCWHVYTCTLIPGSLMLQDDVTERYPGVLSKAAQAIRPEAGKQPEKKRGLWARLFGR